VLDLPEVSILLKLRVAHVVQRLDLGDRVRTHILKFFKEVTVKSSAGKRL